MGEGRLQDEVAHLRARGYRVTAQRRAIIAALREAGRYCTAAQLFARLPVRQDDPISVSSVYRTLEEKAPAHAITLWARRTLAGYDEDAARQLAATEQLLALFPEDLCLQLSRVSHLQHFARREECLAQLKKLCDQDDTHPTCWLQYAQELADDALPKDCHARAHL